MFDFLILGVDFKALVYKARKSFKYTVFWCGFLYLLVTIKKDKIYHLFKCHDKVK